MQRTWSWSFNNIWTSRLSFYRPWASASNKHEVFWHLIGTGHCYVPKTNLFMPQKLMVPMHFFWIVSVLRQECMEAISILRNMVQTVNLFSPTKEYFVNLMNGRILTSSHLTLMDWAVASLTSDFEGIFFPSGSLFNHNFPTMTSILLTLLEFDASSTEPFSSIATSLRRGCMQC